MSKLYFVHIPKCGGSQLKHHFINYGHKSVSELPTKLKKFTIVRNPYDRFISAYFYLQQGGAFDKHNRHLVEKFQDFKDITAFIDVLYKEARTTQPLYHRVTSNDFVNVVHFRPMYTFICNKKNEITIDSVYRFENFNENVKAIFKKYEIKTKVKKTNSSIHQDYMYYFGSFNKDTIRKFNYIYRKDFEMFNYKLL